MRLILIRGLGRDQLHWQPLLKILHQFFPDALIETPDLPGTGILHNESSPTQLAQYIPWLNQQLSNSKEPAILVGLSLGGMIALKWAEQSPDKFLQLVLINSSSRLNYFFQRLKLHQVVCYPEILFSKNKQITENATYRLTCNNRPVNPSLIDEWVEIQRRHPVKRQNQLRQIIAAIRFKLPKAENLPPVHVLYSVADRLVSSQCSKSLIQHYDATWDKHVWAGHDLAQDDPDWIVTRLQRLLDAENIE